eukprot:735655-Pleurochrysis_carterae.AAC.4
MTDAQSTVQRRSPPRRGAKPTFAIEKEAAANKATGIISIRCRCTWGSCRRPPSRHLRVMSERERAQSQVLTCVSPKPAHAPANAVNWAGQGPSLAARSLTRQTGGKARPPVCFVSVCLMIKCMATVSPSGIRESAHTHIAPSQLTTRRVHISMTPLSQPPQRGLPVRAPQPLTSPPTAHPLPLPRQQAGSSPSRAVRSLQPASPFNLLHSMDGLRQICPPCLAVTSPFQYAPPSPSPPPFC